MALSAAQITFFWQREPNASRNDCGAVTQQQVKPSQLPWQPPHAMRRGLALSPPSLGQPCVGATAPQGCQHQQAAGGIPRGMECCRAAPCLRWKQWCGHLEWDEKSGLYFCVNMHMGVLPYTCTYIHTPMHSVHAQIDICMYITKITEQAELEGMTRIIESNSCPCTGSH